jgi:hypothetical protein
MARPAETSLIQTFLSQRDISNGGKPSGLRWLTLIM